jgi:hypothetical protein
MNNYVKALKEAKKLLISRDTKKDAPYSPYICIALRHVRIENKTLAPYCNRIVDYINDCMDESAHCSLEGWLSQQGIIDYDDLNKHLAEEMYQYRLRWIDELIRLYKGKKND